MTLFRPLVLGGAMGGGPRGRGNPGCSEIKRLFKSPKGSSARGSHRVKSPIGAIVLPVPSRAVTKAGGSPGGGSGVTMGLRWGGDEWEISLHKKQMGLNTDAKRASSQGRQRKNNLPRPEVGEIMGLFSEVKTEFPPRPALAAGNEAPLPNLALENAPDLPSNTLTLSSTSTLSFW